MFREPIVIEVEERSQHPVTHPQSYWPFLPRPPVVKHAPCTTHHASSDGELFQEWVWAKRTHSIKYWGEAEYSI